jgi:acetoin utilization deacetylase AcuC-like enzyme
MVGGAVRAVDLIMGGQARNGFVVARPPGHHAERRKGMGFCVFNTVAIAARYLQSRYGLQRIAIIDWDAHHGNGTEKEFATDSAFLYISTHLQGGYPGTGSQRFPNEHTVNCPIMPGPHAREKLLEFYRKELPLLVSSFRPQFMLISCGFDAHAFDPIASLGLETEDFGELTEIASGQARRWCGGKLLSVLEGGYHIESLAACALLHVQVLRRES